MSTLLIVLIIIVILIVLIAWYVSTQIKTQADNSELLLNDNSDRILEKWLKDNSKPTFNLTITSEEIVSKYIKNVYDYRVNPSNIIIGSDLNNKYYQLTNSNLKTVFSVDDDCILYLRSSIGIDYEIAIIYSNKLKDDMKKGLPKINLFALNNVIESNISKSGHDYLRQILNYRWTKLSELNNKNILERDINDTYVYINNIDCNKYNISGLNTEKGVKLNLLCTNQEFEQLLSRLKTL